MRPAIYIKHDRWTNKETDKQNKTDRVDSEIHGLADEQHMDD